MDERERPGGKKQLGEEGKGGDRKILRWNSLIYVHVRWLVKKGGKLLYEDFK